MYQNLSKVKIYWPLKLIFNTKTVSRQSVGLVTFYKFRYYFILILISLDDISIS